MNLFKRSVVSEILNHFSVVLSTLIVVWLSVILVRLIGEAAAGRIGADVVVGLAAFTTIAAMPTVSWYAGRLLDDAAVQQGLTHTSTMLLES